MVYDIATILDLLNELDIIQKERYEILYSYQELIISAENGVLTLFGKIITIQQQMDAILNSINDGVIKINSDGNIALINKKGQDILKVSPLEIVGKKLEDIFDNQSIHIEPDNNINNKLVSINKNI